MVMFSQGLDDDVIDRGNGRIAATLLLDTSPADFRPPAGVLVETPLTYLDDQVPALGEVELWLWKEEYLLVMYLV